MMDVWEPPEDDDLAAAAAALLWGTIGAVFSLAVGFGLALAWWLA